MAPWSWDSLVGTPGAGGTPQPAPLCGRSPPALFSAGGDIHNSPRRSTKMNISHALHCTTHRSWETSGSTTLTMIVINGGVQIQHIDNSYAEPQLTILQLTGGEAVDVAQRILLALRGERPNNGAGDAESPCLYVTSTTDGEPYREGISLALSSGDWARDFSFSMTQDTASELAAALLKVDVLVAA